MNTVYRKSVKGQREIETRADRLAPRLRTALILVDGRRGSDDLRALIQIEPEASLQALVDGGYIEVVATPAPAAPAAGAAASALTARRSLAVRHLTDQLGPLAESVALRIEKTRSWDELRAALEAGQRLLQAARGSAAAARFAEQFIDTPPA